MKDEALADLFYLAYCKSDRLQDVSNNGCMVDAKLKCLEVDKKGIYLNSKFPCGANHDHTSPVARREMLFKQQLYSRY